MHMIKNQKTSPQQLELLIDGMTLALDTHTRSGTLLACKAQPVSDSLSERLINF